MRGERGVQLGLHMIISVALVVIVLEHSHFSPIRLRRELPLVEQKIDECFPAHATPYLFTATEISFSPPDHAERNASVVWPLHSPSRSKAARQQQRRRLLQVSTRVPWL